MGRATEFTVFCGRKGGIWGLSKNPESGNVSRKKTKELWVWLSDRTAYTKSCFQSSHSVTTRVRLGVTEAEAETGTESKRQNGGIRWSREEMGSTGVEAPRTKASLHISD